MPRFCFSLRPGALWTIAVTLTAPLVAGGCGWRTSAPAAQHSSPTVPAMERFEPLVMDVAPITDPKLIPAAETKLDDEQIVIGIEMEGEARAYVRDAFNDPRTHMVRDTIGESPIVVTHCDRLRCTRVFAPEDPSQPLEIRIGGWRTDNTMELVVNGERFSQKAENVPLKSVPFVEMPWAQWRRLHPDSQVYMGEWMLN